jgi:hypothetical protein
MSAPESEDKQLEHMRLVVAEAVAAGIKQAASDPDLWAVALVAMRRRAATSTGNLILDAGTALLKRAAWWVVIALGLYYVGGFTAIAAVMKAYASSGKP